MHGNNRAARRRSRDEAIIDSSDDYDVFEGNAGKRQKGKEGFIGVNLPVSRKRLACPFYKCGEMPGHSACAGPGWPNVTRML
jgi:hypothetical protein